VSIPIGFFERNLIVYDTIHIYDVAMASAGPNSYRIFLRITTMRVRLVGPVIVPPFFGIISEWQRYIIEFQRPSPHIPSAVTRVKLISATFGVTPASRLYNALVV
jgi:hypothetical protein